MFVELLSPKSQNQFVIVPVEVSVKVTTKGSVPLVGVPLKLATGGRAPRRSLYTVAKLSATTALPIDPPSLARVVVPNSEITNEPTVNGGEPLPTGLLAYCVCAP